MIFACAHQIQLETSLKRRCWFELSATCTCQQYCLAAAQDTERALRLDPRGPVQSPGTKHDVPWLFMNTPHRFMPLVLYAGATVMQAGHVACTCSPPPCSLVVHDTVMYD